jgi:hypothetical protein
MRHEDIARVCHEANRALCRAFGDDSQLAWEDAPAWQRDSALAGVRFHVKHPDATPSASHENWLKDKVAEGWSYGPEKLPDEKKHPCMLPFDQLPPQQQAKDYLFQAICHAIRQPT